MLVIGAGSARVSGAKIGQFILMSRYLPRAEGRDYGERMNDPVDKLLDQWSEERPELDWSGLGVVVRVTLLAKLMARSAEQALAPLDLRLWEYDVLSALRRQGSPYSLPASELARAALLSSGAMTTRIDRLAGKGLVRRTPDPDDRRGVNIRLTPRGARLIDAAIEARLRVADAQVARLAPAERRLLSAGLRKLMGGLSRS